MQIPLPKMMRHWREREFTRGDSPWTQRMAVKAWAYLAKRPRLYRFLVDRVSGVLGEWGKPHGHFRWLPLAGSWLKHRDLAAPPGRTFQQQWKVEMARRQYRAEMGG
jgi:L-lactate dehydrogenase complex protein LldF